MRPLKYPLEIRRKAFDLHNQGKTMAEISRMLNIPYSSVRHWFYYPKHQEEIRKWYSAWHRKKYREDPDFRRREIARRKRAKQRQMEKQKVLKRQLVEELGGRCKRCGIQDIRVLEFHHIKPEEKASERRASEASHIRYTKRYREKDKLELLCANCHKLEHPERWLTLD